MYSALYDVKFVLIRHFSGWGERSRQIWFCIVPTEPNSSQSCCGIWISHRTLWSWNTSPLWWWEGTSHLFLHKGCCCWWGRAVSNTMTFGAMSVQYFLRSMLTGTLGPNANYPCPQCKVHHNQLSSLTVKQPARTSGDSNRIIQLAKSAPTKKQAAEILSNNGLSAVEVWIKDIQAIP